jgi:hypothetical protein
MSPYEFSNLWRKVGEEVEGLSARTLAFMTEPWWRTRHCELQVIQRSERSLKTIWNLECSEKKPSDRSQKAKTDTEANTESDALTIENNLDYEHLIF